MKMLTRPKKRKGPGSGGRMKWTDLPFDMQLAILADMPLAELARLATLSKGMRAAYRERLMERHICIQKRLAEGWPAELTEGLSDADLAVPRDLVVNPPIPKRLQCTPHRNTHRHAMHVIYDAKPGVRYWYLGAYRGFCLRGWPDGRGEWTGDEKKVFGSQNWQDGRAHSLEKKVMYTSANWRDLRW